MSETAEQETPIEDPVEALGSDATPEEVQEALGNAGLIQTEAEEGAESQTEEAGAEAPAEESGEDPERPDWLDPKFASVEDQAKAYNDAKRLIGRKAEKPAHGKLNIEDAAEEESNSDGAEGGSQVLDQGRINELGQEWYENDGALSEATLETLSKEYNVAPEVITSMMQTQADANDAANKGILKEAGLVNGEGEADFDAWGQIGVWANKNLSPSEKQQLDEMLDSPSPLNRGAAVRHLKALHDKARGPQSPERLSGNAAGNSTIKPIRSQSELQKAMDDERYFEDSPRGAKYRAEVEKRVELGSE